MATVTIQKRKGMKGTSYAVKYRDPSTGKRKHYKSYRKFKDANQATNDLRTMLDLGKAPDRKKKLFCPMSFKEAADLCKAEWGKRQRKGEISPKTLDEYEIWANQLCRLFGKRVVATIKKPEIEEHVQKVAETRSNVTANKHLSILKKIFRMAATNNGLIEDFMPEIKALPEKMHVRNRFLLPTQLNTLLAATQAQRAKHYMPAMICLGAEHGASKQEILSLKWSEIDFDFEDRGLIRFYRTKNNRHRTQFLMPRTREALLSWKNHLEYKRRRLGIKSPKSDFVFCRIDGTPIKNFQNAWRTALKATDISDFHFHDLRHTYCSNLILSGAGIKEVKEMIGHSDISMTDRYSHLITEHEARTQDTLSRHYAMGLSN